MIGGINIGVTFIGKWSFVSKTADFDENRGVWYKPWFLRISRRELMCPPWILIPDCKLFESFTTFKPKTQTTVFGVKTAVLLKTTVFGINWGLRLQKLWFLGFSGSRGLGLPSSKVFQNEKPNML